MGKCPCIYSNQFILSLWAKLQTVRNVFPSYRQFKIIIANILKVCNNQHLANIPLHLGLKKYLKIVCVEDTIFLIVHFINLYICCLVKDDGPTCIILSQVSENLSLMEVFEVLPSVFLLYFFPPFEVVKKVGFGFFEIKFFGNEKSTDSVLLFVRKHFPQNIEMFQKLFGYFLYQRVLFPKNCLSFFFHFLLYHVFILQKNTLHLIKHLCCRVLPQIFLKEGSISVFPKKSLFIFY